MKTDKQFPALGVQNTKRISNDRLAKKTVIISGGMLEEAFVLETLRGEDVDFIIGVDRGAAFLYNHQITPDYIVGDFDSLEDSVLDYYKTQTEIPIREFNPVKDASDTEIAVRLAVELCRENVMILGATGSRIDHIMANIQTLKIGYDAGIHVEIMDSHNRIYLIGGKTVLEKDKAFGSYFSVFPLGTVIEDFNIRGAKYPLTHHTLVPYDSLCVSNQMEEERVTIDFPEGFVILMETRD